MSKLRRFTLIGLMVMLAAILLANGAAYAGVAGPPGGGTPSPTDSDGDGIDNGPDNCDSYYNPTQTDTDHDGSGDACDWDKDADGVYDTNPSDDQCPLVYGPASNHGCPITDPDGDGRDSSGDNCDDYYNPDQTDTDHDGSGDACDWDKDADGVPDVNPNADQCPLVYGSPINFGCPINDRDGDGAPDETDNCRGVVNSSQLNTDGDQYGNACDDDDDNDGVLDTSDNCPLIRNAGQADGDGDGIGNKCDFDFGG